jgi:hypothetical protein
VTAEELREHKRLVRAAWRARKKVEGEGGRRMLPSHLWADVGPAIAAPDHQPPKRGNPEEIMAAAFLAMGGRTYAAPPQRADALGELRTVLQGAD